MHATVESRPVQILIADDDPIVRQVVRAVLREYTACAILGEAEDGRQACEMVAQQAPDILLLDDMDNMFEGQAEPGKYEAVYKVVKKIARLQKIPVIALSQAKERGDRAGTFLGKNDAAWSASNERSAAMLIALQQAGYMDAGWKGDDTFPITEDPMQYIMFWKSRDGWPVQQGPGAIIMNIEKDEFGRTKSRMWKGPLYEGQMKLHMPRRSAHAFPAAK